MRQQTVNIYTFDELSDAAKQKAIDAARYWDVQDSEWWDFVYDNSKSVAALMGIDIDRIYFSGFWSQGDGACFEGPYSYERDSVNRVKEYAPQDSELHEIAEALAAIQKRNFYQLHATTYHSGFYQHSGCMRVNVERDSANYQDMTSDAESDLIDALRAFADWIYSRLESEYEYLTSDEYVKERLSDSGLEFTEDGVFA